MIMTNMKILSLFVIVALTAGISSVDSAAERAISNHIAACYTNTTLLDRFRKPGMSMENLIYLIRKIENHKEMKMRDMREVLSGIVNKYKMDGYYAQMTSASPYQVGVFTETFDYKKHELLKVIGSDSLQDIPPDVLQQEEECALHWMLSHVVNNTRRDDEDPYNYRFKRDSLRFNKDSFRAKSRAKRQKPIGAEGEQWSDHPTESGVVYTKYGTVSGGNLIQGILAGLQNSNTKIKEVVNKNTYINKIMELDINNLYAQTMSGDLGQTVTIYGTYDDMDQVGPKGKWNDTICPSEYYLSINATAMTEAEVNGGMDGLLLGLRVRDWEGSNLRASQLLYMYYSEQGVAESKDPTYRACDRRKLYEDNINKEMLKTQAVNFAYAYRTYISGVPVFPYNKTGDYVARAFGQLESFISAMSQPDCDADAPSPEDDNNNNNNNNNNNDDNDNDIAKIYKSISDVQHEVGTDLYILLDMDVGTQQEREHVKTIIAGISARLGNGSRVALYLGESTEVRNIYRLEDNDGLTCVACRILDLDLDDTSSMDFYEAILYMNEILVAEERIENKNNTRSTNSKVLLIMSPKTQFEDDDGNLQSWEDFLDFHSYLHTLVIADSSWEPMAKEHLISYSSSSDSSIETALDKIEEFPGRLLDPKCMDDYDESENKDSTSLFITPGTVKYYQLNAMYFHAAESFSVKFKVANGGTIMVCESREADHPNVAGSDRNCQQIGQSGGRDYTFEYDDACEDLGDQNARYCDPISYSIEAQTQTSGSSSNCNEIECTRPDQIIVDVYIEDAVCSAYGLLASPFIWLLAIVVALLNRH